ncbi:hypothetical protein BOX15_Mlig007357g1, partial [Macrostomum lignano]
SAVMAETIYDTVVSYIENCKASQLSANAFVLDVLQRLKDESAFDDDVETFDLKLCANNKLSNTRNIRLVDADAAVLCRTLRSSTIFVCVDLRYNSIGDSGAEAIADMLSSNKTITMLNLMCNNVGEAGAKAIAKSLHTNQTLLELNLAGNKINDAGGMLFAEALQVNATLEFLDLGDCDLKINAVIALSTVLKYNDSLRGINVNRPLLWTQQEETTVHMGEMLAQNRSLRELHLAKYEMRDFGANRIADGLVANRALTVLDLSCNRITRDGAKVLANVLCRDTPLQLLDLSYNRLECDGAKCIASALIGANTNLRCLVIKFNEIKSDGLVAVADSLKYNTSLERLFIWGNDLTDASCAAAYAELLGSSGRLREDDTDVRAYSVDDRWCLSQVNRDVDYRLYRFTAPVYGDQVPQDRRFRLN